MILKRLFRKTPAAERRLYEAIVAAARHPVPYANWGIADTIDGRFDMITLHMFLILDRLRGEAAGFRQNLVDELFADMDRSLREMGVGDLSVGKKVRKMAEVFYGRLSAYESALGKGKEELAAALARNVFPDGASERASASLTDYMLAARQVLAALSAERVMAGAVMFPEPQP